MEQMYVVYHQDYDYTSIIAVCTTIEHAKKLSQTYQQCNINVTIEEIQVNPPDPVTYDHHTINISLDRDAKKTYSVSSRKSLSPIEEPKEFGKYVLDVTIPQSLSMNVGPVQAYLIEEAASLEGLEDKVNAARKKIFDRVDELGLELRQIEYGPFNKQKVTMLSNPKYRPKPPTDFFTLLPGGCSGKR